MPEELLTAAQARALAENKSVVDSDLKAVLQTIRRHAGLGGTQHSFQGFSPIAFVKLKELGYEVVQDSFYMHYTVSW